MTHDALVARARAKLPHEPVPVAELVERIDDALATGATLDAIHAEDLYLACAMRAGDPRAIAIAEAELLPGVKQAAAKIDRDPAFVDEVSQLVRERVLVGDPPGIASYRGTGPLGRWIRVVASRIALDLKRAARESHADDELDHLPAPHDPELDLLWRASAAEYRAALATVFGELDTRARNLLRQRYLDGLTIDALGRIYGVHPATAFRWLRDIERQLATATRHALMVKLAVSESQVASIERLVASQLRISLTRMLKRRNR